MQRLLLLLITAFLFSCPIFSKEELFDNPIDYDSNKACKLNEYCKRNIDDIDLEKYIKKELENNYIEVRIDE